MPKVNISLQKLIKSFIATYPVQSLIKNAKKHYATSPLKVISGSVLVSGICATMIFKDSSKPDTRLGSKERFFLKFASVEYNGQVCMTPQDFLDSIVEEEPRYNRRKVLGKRDMEEVIKSAKGLRPGTPRIFGSLRDKGIISYTEFLFLLSVLTKPESGFRIAFDMFDVDGNENIDKKEFLVMEKIFSQRSKGKKADGNGLELQRNQKFDTTLLIYFFGLRDTKTLNFDAFKTFMINLQTEIMEIQFNEFSKGSPTISEYDFAVILLSYTRLDENHKAKYLRRLTSKVNGGQGIITFDEFCVFGKLLKNLDDFSVAVKMYILADRPITKRDFLRAAKICVGTNLSVRIVDTVFALFDNDYDGFLSYEEFIAVMNERGRWSFKSQGNSSKTWKAFRKCVSKEIK